VRGNARQCTPVRTVGYTFGDTFAGVLFSNKDADVVRPARPV
jgi:hypothetical protein